MQSWVIDKAKSISLVQEDQQDVNLKTHARVKIARASLCQSDAALFQGKLGSLPIIPSRNALGIISAINQVDCYPSWAQTEFLNLVHKKSVEKINNDAKAKRTIEKILEKCYGN